MESSQDNSASLERLSDFLDGMLLGIQQEFSCPKLEKYYGRSLVPLSPTKIMAFLQ